MGEKGTLAVKEITDPGIIGEKYDAELSTTENLDNSDATIIPPMSMFLSRSISKQMKKSAEYLGKTLKRSRNIATSPEDEHQPDKTTFTPPEKRMVVRSRYHQ